MYGSSCAMVISVGSGEGLSRLPGTARRPPGASAALQWLLIRSPIACVLCAAAPAAFTLDPSLGEFVLTTPALQVPPTGTIYSINEGNSSLWDEPTSR